LGNSTLIDVTATLSAIGGMALSLAYGLQIQPTNDPFLDLAETAAKSISAAASFGAFFVDVIPILKYVPEWVPGAGFQKKARIWRKIQEDFREIPYSSSIEAMVPLLMLIFMNDFTLISFFRPLVGLGPHSHQCLWLMSTKVLILITNGR
jgi:hypothetical protein